MTATSEMVGRLVETIYEWRADTINPHDLRARLAAVLAGRDDE